MIIVKDLRRGDYPAVSDGWAESNHESLKV